MKNKFGFYSFALILIYLLTLAPFDSLIVTIATGFIIPTVILGIVFSILGLIKGDSLQKVVAIFTLLIHIAYGLLWYLLSNAHY